MTSKKQEPTDEELAAQEQAPAKQPKHIAVAIRHLTSQRERAIAARDKAEGEVKRLDAALLALGWPEK